MLMGLLAGVLPVVGVEPSPEGKSGPGQSPNLESPNSNCSHLTLKLEFSSKVVEHGKK